MNEKNQLDDFIIEYEEASYSKKFFARMIDAILVFGIYFLVQLLVLDYSALSYRSYQPLLILFLILLSYRSISILLFSGTPGMLIMKTRYLTSTFKHPSNKEKIAAAFFVLMNDIDHYSPTS